jgi:RpiR family transcriptional regulator, carbohydrate utilization regulator
VRQHQSDSGSQNILDFISKEQPYLNPALRRVADYILEHPNRAKSIPIHELAEECGVAESSVTRFVKVIGLKSYQELKIAIAETLSARNVPETEELMEEKFVFEGITRSDSEPTIVDKVMSRNIQTLLDTKQRLNFSQVSRAVDAIDHAQVLIFCCMGSSSLAAEEAVMRFTRAGKKCLLFRDQSIQLMTAAIVNKDDLVFGLSNSGRSAQVVECLNLAQSRGARTIAVTSYEDSPLVTFADIALFTATKSASKEYGLYRESMTSKMAQILVIDILYAIFASRYYDQTLQHLEETYLAAIRDTRKT